MERKKYLDMLGARPAKMDLKRDQRRPTNVTIIITLYLASAWEPRARITPEYIDTVILDVNVAI